MRTKRFSQWTAVTIVLTSLFSPMVTPIFASDDGGKIIAASTPYSDVYRADESTQSSILLAYQRGLMTGYSDGQFRPLGLISREEFAAVIVNVLHLQVNAGGTSSFADVADADWGRPYVEAVHAAGLMGGDGGNFRPHDPITRQEMAVVLSKAAGLEVPGNGMRLTFADDDTISPWAVPYVQAAVEAGLLSGEGVDFNPPELVRRQDVAVIAVQLSNRFGHVIQDVHGGFVTIGRNTYQVPDALKGIFSDANADALNGAWIDAQFDGNTITKIDRLELTTTALPYGVQALVFDGQGNTVAGNLVIGGGVVTVRNVTVSGDLTMSTTAALQTLDHVQVQGAATLQGAGGATYSLSNDSFGALVLQTGNATWQFTGSTSAASISVQANGTLSADHDMSGSKVTVAPGVQLQLNAQVGELDVTGTPLPSLTLSNEAKIGNLVLPYGVKGGEVVANYASVLLQIPLINGVRNPDWPLPHHLYDKKALASEITNAQNLELAAKPGSDIGDTPQKAFDALNQAIQNATVVENDPNATPTQVDQTVRNLKNAESAFRSAKIKPVVLSLHLQKGAKAYANPSLPNQENEVTLSANPPFFYSYGKQSLLTMISVQNGNAPMSLEYDPVNDDYKVLDQGTEVGEVHVSSTNSLLKVEKGLSGDVMIPLTGLKQSSSPRLHVELDQNGSKVGAVDVPVIVDTTPPTVYPQGTYNAVKGTITVTTSEDLVPPPFFDGPNQPDKSKMKASDLALLPFTSLNVYASPNKPFADGSSITLQNGRDYTYAIAGNMITITLTAGGKSLLSTDNILTCKVVVNGSDYAWNSVDPNHNSAMVTIK